MIRRIVEVAISSNKLIRIHSNHRSSSKVDRNGCIDS